MCQTVSMTNVHSCDAYIAQEEGLFPLLLLLSTLSYHPTMICKVWPHLAVLAAMESSFGIRHDGFIIFTTQCQGAPNFVQRSFQMLLCRTYVTESLPHCRIPKSKRFSLNLDQALLGGAGNRK